MSAAFQYRALTLSVVIFCAGPASADDLKIGLIAPFSGPSSDAGGPEMENGMRAYLKIHGDTVAGRKIVIIRKDAPSPAPDVARRLAQELVTRDKVDVLAGHIFTPTAIAAGQVSTQAKVPMLIMNAATSGILAKMPYTARASFTLAQTTAPLARWANKNGIKRVFTVVADYAPGIDSETAFLQELEKSGNSAAGSIRVPLDTIDFASYIRRIQDTQPGAVFAFLPASDQAKNFIKAFREAGLDKAGVRLLAEGGMVHPAISMTLDDDAIGTVSSHHYSDDHQTAVNAAFVAAFKTFSPGGRAPSYIAVGAYDAMEMLFLAVKMQEGKLDPDRTMQIWREMAWESPRGPVRFDPASRDIVQNVYIRKLERKNGALVNVEFDTFANVNAAGRQ